MTRSAQAALEAASRWIGRASAAVVVALAGVMVACLLLQVVFRYGVGRALTWSDEIALLSFLWIVFLAGSLGVREAFHVRLTLAVDRLPPAWRAGSERIVLLLVLGFGLLLLHSGAEYVAITAGSISPAIGYPVELLHLAAPVAGALIILHALARLFGGGRAGAAGLAV